MKLDNNKTCKLYHDTFQFRGIFLEVYTIRYITAGILFPQIAIDIKHLTDS